MNVNCVRLNESLRSDYYRLHSERCDAGWCFCVAWWTEDWESFPQRSAIRNRALRDELFAVGQYDGYLIYLDDEVAGWSQCGQRDRLPKLLSTYRLEPDPSTWAYTCFLLPEKWRGRNLGHEILRLSLQDLRQRGVRRVQGFPRRGADLEPEDAWQGTERMYQRAGFTCIRESDDWPVYEIGLKPE